MPGGLEWKGGRPEPPPPKQRTSEDYDSDDCLHKLCMLVWLALVGTGITAALFYRLIS